MYPAVATSFILFLALCAPTVSVAGTAASINMVAHTQQTAALAAIERIGAWWAKPAKLQVQPLLPAARPQQPWPYRTLSSAELVSLTLTESYALEAAVVHGPLQGEVMCPFQSATAASASLWQAEWVCEAATS